MFSILPCSDADRLSAYPEDTTLLIYKDNGIERGYIAYGKYKSAVEILAMETGEEITAGAPLSDEAFIHCDALIRAVGSIALGAGCLTLCSRDESLLPVWEKFGFFRQGEFYTLYLNKLFAKGCSGCSGCGK